MKLKGVIDHPGLYLFHCPGCDSLHQIHSKESLGERGWEFNESRDKPTFRPSFLTWWNEGEKEFRCHSYITDGKIKFQSDCTHDLKGLEVELPEIESTSSAKY